MKMPRRQKNQKQNDPVHIFWLKKLYKTCDNSKIISSYLFNENNLFPVAVLLFVFEFLINVTIINRVNYTEIDWKAYMQEVEGVLNGTFDYLLIKGDTGPIAYPAGFVWIFSGLYFLTDKGTNILLAQYIFAILYLINLILVLRIYKKASKVPPYVFIFTCLTSYRIHSIFVLRLFNDPIATLLLYASINAFLDGKWSLGSFLYSLAVSIKMNILLFAPALFLAYVYCLKPLNVIKQLGICAVVQVALALPFLLTYPISYFLGAFNFGRVFLYEWTVNWKFLPEDIFVNKLFHLILLIAHIILLVVFLKICMHQFSTFAAKNNYPRLLKNPPLNQSSSFFILPMFLANFIGISCSRSLHYQFYIWYYHTLPFLLWSTHYTTATRLLILGIVELCWNTFVNRKITSLLLQICHAAVLYGIFKKQTKIKHK